MALTRDFRETVKARVERDEKFRKALLREALTCLISGEVDVGRAMLKDFINATVGFPALADAVQQDSKSLLRMFGPRGNPTSNKLFPVIHYLQTVEHCRARVELG